MLSTLQSKDEQVDKSGKLDVIFRQRVENIATKGEKSSVKCRQCEVMD